MGSTFDVAILGGGKAGGLLARQLRRHVPSASVVLIERSRERSFKVGESTVDVCGKYLTKRLGLSSYLYDAHLPKNGLRFFFDREDKQGSLEELSEIGTGGLIPFPSFQIDRARLEEDVLRMNAAGGVDVRLGVRAADVTLGEGGAPHAIALEEDGVATGTITARWVIDASGRASVIARKKGLRTESSLAHAAVWGRYRGVLDLDDVGPESFHARVRHTSRVLSTNHFSYPGYWIWLIPLGRGVTSVGVVMEKERFGAQLRSREGFEAFLRSHAAVAGLMKEAEALDTMSYGQLAYGTTRFADGNDRWALVGEAAAFTDPLYSPGGDYIALENDWVTDLVARDLAGEAVASRARLYEEVLLARLAGTELLYDGLYGTLGSFELFASKWDLDTACYLSLWVEPYLLDRHLDLGAVQREIDGRHATLGVLRSLRATFLEAERALRSEGRFFAKNLGHLVLDPAVRFLQPDFGTAASERRQMPRVRDALELVTGELREKLGRAPLAERLPFSAFTSGRSVL